MKKRAERTKFNRTKQSQELYDDILIVCEGAKTEPYYFDGLKKALRITNARIRICGKECGSSPLSVVKYALEQQKKFGHNRIFCVFDKDAHERYQSALDKIRTSRMPKGTTIAAITSVPCFEFWLLIHYEDTARQYVAIGDKSAGDLVTHDLKKYIPDYDKGHKKIFEITQPHLDTAMRRAELLEKRNEETRTENPSTKVHKLVGYMKELMK